MYVHHSIRNPLTKGTTIMKRPAAILAAAILTGALTYSSLSAIRTDVPPSVTPAPIAQCQRDTATDAECTYAWQVWDYSGGPSKLRMDPSKPFRVDYLGSTADYPRDLAEYDLALVGKDGNWYVFRAVAG